MAGGSSDLSKLTSLIDKFFKLFNNFIDGYQVQDNNVAKESGNISSELVLSGTGPDGTDIKVKLTATNVKSAFKDITSKIDGLSAMGISKQQEKVEPDDYEEHVSETLHDFDAASTQIHSDSILAAATLSSESAKFLEKLLGEGCLEKQDSAGIITYEGDITVEAAKKRDEGLLGINLNTVAAKGKLTDPSFSEWKTKAFETMRYSLICEAENYDTGSVSDAKLTDCIVWINKYIKMISEKASESTGSTSREDKLADAKSINTAALILVTPILDVIQSELVKLYQDKLNSSASELDKLIPGNEPKEGENTSEFNNDALIESEAANEVAQQNQQSQQGDDTTAMQHIEITLKKVQASDDIAILRLQSDYAPGATLSDIDEVISQEEFLDELTEEPQAFDISVDEDGFDVEKCDECPECNPCESLCEVFKAGIRAYRNLYILHWMSSGNDMMKLHNLSEEMYDELQSEIDTVGELLVEKQGTVPQLDFPCDYIAIQKYDFQTGLDQIKSLIQMYIDCIDYAYCNQDSDVQSTLDEWLRYWNKQLNYFVKGQEI